MPFKDFRELEMYSTRVARIAEMRYNQSQKFKILPSRVHLPLHIMSGGRAVDVEGTLLFVDIAYSTEMFTGRNRLTYMKFAHVFYTTLYYILVRSGAVKNFIEYMGDGMLAYFVKDTRTENARKAIKASILAQLVIENVIDSLYPSLEEISIKISLHHGGFLLANIGMQRTPLKFLGQPLHIVSKTNDEAKKGEILVTDKFYEVMPEWIKNYIKGNGEISVGDTVYYFHKFDWRTFLRNEYES